jgi:hypothetical protein
LLFNLIALATQKNARGKVILPSTDVFRKFSPGRALLHLPIYLHALAAEETEMGGHLSAGEILSAMIALGPLNFISPST